MDKKEKFDAKQLINEATFEPISQSSNKRRRYFKMLLVSQVRGNIAVSYFLLLLAFRCTKQAPTYLVPPF